MNAPAPLFSTLLRAPLAARVGAAFVLVATVAVGLPHAFVSNALLIALAGALIAWGVHRNRQPAPSVTPSVAPSATADFAEKTLTFLIIAWVSWSFVRAGLGRIWHESASWSGLGHSVAFALPFALAALLRAPLGRLGDPAILVGLAGVALLAILNASFPGNALRLFEGYRVYLGNDSIAIDMMLTLLASGVVLTMLATWLRAGREPSLKQAGLMLLALLPLFAFAQSRSALIVFVISVALGALVVARTWWQRLIVPAVVLGLVVAAYVVSPLARQRLEKAVAEVEAAVADHYIATSQGQRLALASVSGHVVRDRPFTGHGLGMWRTEFAKRVPPQWQFAIGRHTSPHNEYLHIAAQLGLGAVLLYAGVWLCVFVLGVRQLRQRASPWLFLIAIAFLVGSITNVMLWDFRFWAPFSALLTAALTCARTETR